MAREIRGASSSGTLYARIINTSGLWWNGTTFEAYTAANYGNYDIAMTEQGSSNVYVADFPTGITTGGTYEYFVHRQAGGSPAEGDAVINTGKIDWTGTASITAASGSMSGSEFQAYVLRKGFKRTDKDTELYEAVTDAIQEMRRRHDFDESETDATTTDTISTLGDFRIAVESDFGLLIGVVLQDGTNATPLKKISKAEFDQLYPDSHVSSDRGYPDHFCIYAGSIYVGPIPDSTSYTYRKSYAKSAGTVTSSTTGVPFTNVYRDVLAELTLANLYETLQEYDMAQFHRAEFERKFEESKRKDRINSGRAHFNMRIADC